MIASRRQSRLSSTLAILPPDSFSDLMLSSLVDYEVSFLRLIEKLTNGTTIEISYTGTTVLLHPGLLPGGTYTHTCPTSRGIGYFLEPLVVLGCFGKRALEITLDGITGEEGRDLSVSPGDLEEEA